MTQSTLAHQVIYLEFFMLVVKTKDELQKAIDNKINHFEVEGELAEKLKKGQKITTLGKFTLAVLTVAIAGIVATPATGGISGVAGFSAASTVATLTGLEIAVIMSVAFLGIGMLIALFKDYNVEYETDPKNGKVKAKFTRKN